MCLVISLLMVLTLSSYHMHAYTGEEDIVVSGHPVYGCVYVRLCKITHERVHNHNHNWTRQLTT